MVNKKSKDSPVRVFFPKAHRVLVVANKCLSTVLKIAVTVLANTASDTTPTTETEDGLSDATTLL